MRFLDVPDEQFILESAGATILPIPYDATTSWLQGTDKGPEAIIAASHHIELYDEELEQETSEACGGIHTFSPLIARPEPKLARQDISDQAGKLINENKLMVSLGGEHSITFPLVEAHAELWPDLCVLQVDAPR